MGEMMKKTSTMLMTLLLILFGAVSITPALAQDVLFGTDTPTWGEINIGLIEFADPFIVTFNSGGPFNAAQHEGIAENCRGYVTGNPSHRVNIVSGEVTFLRIMFVAQGDTTLIVQAPDGSWQCNDDSALGDFALSPMVDIANPAEGPYNVWVGSFDGDQLLPGYLMYTQNVNTHPGQIVSALFGTIVDPDDEISASDLAPNSDDESDDEISASDLAPNSSDESPTCEGGINYACEPNYGEVSLASGFSPDPFTIHMTSGGSINVLEQGLPAECRGNVTAAPDFRLNLTSSSPRIRIYFVADTSGSDTTLIVNSPSATWHCNDDYPNANLNPMVEITDADDGQYDIWVGSFTTGEFISGTLYITELDTTPVNP
jgi:hypothetical protein